MNHRTKRNRKAFATYVREDLLEQLDELSEETRIAKTRLVDEALELLFEKHKAKEE